MSFLRLFPGFSLRTLALGCCFTFFGGAPLSAKTPDDFSTIAEETFRTVWNVIRETYYDPDFGGMDWIAHGNTLAEDLPLVENQEDLRHLLGRLLAGLGQSHFAILPGAGEWLDADLAGEGYTGIALAWDPVREEVLVAEVEPDSPARRAGFQAGMALQSAGETAFPELWERISQSPLAAPLQVFVMLQQVSAYLGAAPGAVVEVAVETPAGDSRLLNLEPAPWKGALTQPFGHMPPMRQHFRAQTLSEDRIQYIRFSPFMADLMPELRRIVGSLNREGRTGLILDLRDNPGGIGFMANGLAGLLTSENINLGTMQLRAGTINFIGFPQPGAFLGPVAILVSEQTASTSEIFAAGLQEVARARVFGRPTAGAALPSYFRELPNGDILQHAVADFTTPAGQVIEGRGVRPDVLIPARRNVFASGEDPVLGAALDWLETETAGPSIPAEY